MSYPTDYFKYIGQELSVEGVKVSRLVKKYGTPLYIYSSKGFSEPIRKLQSGLSQFSHLVCFAVKSNTNQSILINPIFFNELICI